MRQAAMEKEGSLLLANHAQLKESVDALRTTLKSLENTRMLSSNDPTLSELKESIRVAIEKAEAIVAEAPRTIGKNNR